MTKRKAWITILMFALALVIGVFTLSACGGTKYAVTWDVEDGATVKVEGYTELPTEVKEGDSLVITVETETGWEVSAVRVNDRAVTAKEGKYTVAVTPDTTISAETEEVVSSVSVTNKPSKLVYIAGETLDTTGMVVEVEYGTGRTANEINYTIVYENGSTFSLGDTGFKVKFKGVESDTVALTSSVEVKIEIDPAGGTVSEGYIATLRENADLHNLNVDANGVITFTYAELATSVLLPTEDQWSRGEDGDYVFTSWTGGATEIAVDNAASNKYTAAYKAVLLALEGIKYENVTEGDEVVPYLIIEGTFKAAKTAYLYLYEGNDKVELVGDSVGDENTQRGDEFELKFDMRKLVEKNYVGKWMDIKFVAEEGENKEVQEILLSDYPEDFVDLDQIIVNGDYSYSFATYNGLLKALYSNYFKNEYTMVASTDKDGNAVLTINGVVDTKWAGKTVVIDFTAISKDGDDVKYAVVNADGSYTIEFNFKNYNLNTDGYAHFRIVESEADSSNVLYKDGDGNLLNAGCQNTDLEIMNFGLIENNGALRVSNADGTAVYYVGKGKWNGIVIRGVNESMQMTGVTLATKNDKPCLVIEGTYGAAYNDTIIEALTGNLFAELLNNGDSSSGSISGDWTGTTLVYQSDNPDTPATIFVEAADGAWKIYLDLSARNNTIGEVLFVHFSFEGNTGTNLESTNIDAETKITFTETDGDKIEFSLGEFTTWGGHVVSVYVKAAE